MNSMAGGDEFTDYCRQDLIDRHNRVVDRFDVLEASGADPHWWRVAGLNAELHCSPLAIVDLALEESCRKEAALRDAGRSADRAAVVERWIIAIQDAEQWVLEAERLAREVKRLARADAQKKVKMAKLREKIHVAKNELESRYRNKGLIGRIAKRVGCSKSTVGRALSEH